MTTVHLILHAHLDPVWLWPWQAGLDEAIATCRSACDRLQNNPDAIFTFGDAWCHRMIERADPKLFARIAGYVSEGRWEVAGGWWIQPDCNQPSGAGLAKQIELGRNFFFSRFGLSPRIAMNVDSFGHAASLPSIMKSFGQDRYVMMRPSRREMSLPARVFRWRGFEGEDAIVTFRIGGGYGVGEVTAKHIAASVRDLPPGIEHTMCFIGLGDHGGGPTERQIAWCREHANAIPDCRLVFSSPSRFFDAIEEQGHSLPLVTGELQHHAVGCYSVTRSIKVAVRRAEHLLTQAEVVSGSNDFCEPATAARIAESWELVCFNHFHDTLGGTCIPSAYSQLDDQLGYAKAVADDVIQVGLRRQLCELSPDRRQRIVLLNASDRVYSGYTIVAPWTEFLWNSAWRIVDERGANIAYQLIKQEAVADSMPGPQVLLRVELAAAGLNSLFIDQGNRDDDDGAARLVDDGLSVEPNGLRSLSTGIRFEPSPTLCVGPMSELKPLLTLFQDLTDTWSHGVARLGTTMEATASWTRPVFIDRGPLMVSALQRGSIADSDLVAEWRIYAGECAAELLLRVHWRAFQKVLKLVLPLSSTLIAHTDGIPGRALRRMPEDKERPIRDFTHLHLADGDFGVVCPDVFAMEADKQAVAFTLLRSPLMAHHDPAKPEDGLRAVPSDQGVHTFRFLFAFGERVTSAWLDERALMYHRPLVSSDWTYGMQGHSYF